MKAYRWLLRAYPAAFRARYGAEMEGTFGLMLRAARARGGRPPWPASGSARPSTSSPTAPGNAARRVCGIEEHDS